MSTCRSVGFLNWCEKEEKVPVNVVEGELNKFKPKVFLEILVSFALEKQLGLLVLLLPVAPTARGLMILLLLLMSELRNVFEINFGFCLRTLLIFLSRVPYLPCSMLPLNVALFSLMY